MIRIHSLWFCFADKMRTNGSEFLVLLQLTFDSYITIYVLKDIHYIFDYFRKTRCKLRVQGGQRTILSRLIKKLNFNMLVTTCNTFVSKVAGYLVVLLSLPIYHLHTLF